MNWLWSGILLLIAMFCSVGGTFAHDEGKAKRGNIIWLIGIICNILAILCILL